MKRVLKFEPDSIHLPTVYEGVLLGINSTPPNERKNKRQEARVIRALEAVSEETDETFPNSKKKQRRATGGSIELSQEDITFICKTIEGFSWPSIDVVRAMNAVDYLEALKQVEE